MIMSVEYKRGLVFALTISFLITVLLAFVFSIISDRINQQGVDKQLIFQPTNPTVFDFFVRNFMAYVIIFVLLALNIYYSGKFGFSTNYLKRKRFYILFFLLLIGLFIPFISGIIVAPLWEVLNAIPFCYLDLYCGGTFLGGGGDTGLYPKAFFGWVVSLIYIFIVSYPMSLIGFKQDN